MYIICDWLVFKDFRALSFATFHSLLQARILDHCTGTPFKMLFFPHLPPFHHSFFPSVFLICPPSCSTLFELTFFPGLWGKGEKYVWWLSMKYAHLSLFLLHVINSITLNNISYYFKTVLSTSVLKSENIFSF